VIVLADMTFATSFIKLVGFARSSMALQGFALYQLKGCVRVAVPRASFRIAAPLCACRCASLRRCAFVRVLLRLVCCCASVRVIAHRYASHLCVRRCASKDFVRLGAHLACPPRISHVPWCSAVRLGWVIGWEGWRWHARVMGFMSFMSCARMTRTGMRHINLFLYVTVDT